MQHRSAVWSGAGLGLRRAHLDAFREGLPTGLDFLEIAPENWAGVGGPDASLIQRLSEQVPMVLHGLCLNLGGTDPLDMGLVHNTRLLMKRLNSPFFSDHLAWTGHGGNLYDLLPLPFTQATVRHVADRISQVQDALGQTIGVENVSTYALTQFDEMSELDFLLELQRRSACHLHLDVNNVYVNSQNHGFDAKAFIAALPSAAIRYLHVAGHYVEDDGLLIDTHGTDVIDPVWALLAHTYACHGTKPTLLERDFNIPPLDELMAEVGRIAQVQAEHHRLAGGERELA